MNKKIREMTPEQIRTAGLEALTRELGVEGMVRFLQQFDIGSGDYTKERYTWLQDTNVESLVRQIEEQRQSSS